MFQALLGEDSTLLQWAEPWTLKLKVYWVYLSTICVHAKKLKQGLDAISGVKQLWRQMPIQEFDTVADRRGPRHVREIGIERREVELQHKRIMNTAHVRWFSQLCTLASINLENRGPRKLKEGTRKLKEGTRNLLGAVGKLLFEPQILRNRELLQSKLLHVDAQVLPDSRPWTHRKSHPGRQHHSLLHYFATWVSSFLHMQDSKGVHLPSQLEMIITWLPCQWAYLRVEQ